MLPRIGFPTRSSWSLGSQCSVSLVLRSAIASSVTCERGEFSPTLGVPGRLLKHPAASLRSFGALPRSSNTLASHCDSWYIKEQLWLSPGPVRITSKARSKARSIPSCYSKQYRPRAPLPCAVLYCGIHRRRLAWLLSPSDRTGCSRP